MKKIDWKDPLPFSHKGRWHKNQKSIMSPGAKVTWPQFVMECIIFNRTIYWSFYKNVKQGEGWFEFIPKDVRTLSQQAYAVCDYFPHPEDEPLVCVAFKNVLRNNRITKIGQYRKTRVSKEGKTTVTLDEQNFITAVQKELERLMAQRDTFRVIKTENELKAVSGDSVKFETTSGSRKSKKLSFSDLDQTLENQ